MQICTRWYIYSRQIKRTYRTITFVILILFNYDWHDLAGIEFKNIERFKKMLVINKLLVRFLTTVHKS